MALRARAAAVALHAAHQQAAAARDGPCWFAVSGLGPEGGESELLKLASVIKNGRSVFFSRRAF